MENQTETYAERSAREAKEKIESNNRNIEHIFKALQEKVTSLGCNIEVTHQNKHGETHPDTRIKITHPDLKYFCAEILGREWNDHDRASLWVETQYRKETKGRKLSDGSYISEYTTIDFNYKLSHQDRIAIGIETTSHNPLYSLRVGFKATKNPKLICNDVIPALTKYLEAMKIIEPKIETELERDNQVLNLQKWLNRFAEYDQHIYEKTERQTFSTELGRITIEPYGTIKLEKELSEKDLREMFKNEKPKR